MANSNLQIKCRWCGKLAFEKKRVTIGTRIFLTLDCGHSAFKDVVKVESFEEMVSKDGRSPFPFQVQTADWAEKAGLSCLIGHQQGLGKTVIANLLLKRYHDQMTPTLVVTPAGVMMQWWCEVVRWTGHIPQIIDSSRALPQFDFTDIFIISYDTLRNVRPVEFEDEYEKAMAIRKGKGVKAVDETKKKEPAWSDEVVRKFKSIIIDECQRIKNSSAGRTKSIKDFVKQMMIATDGNAHVIPMSGTPARNRPSELFNALHLVRPELFPIEAEFKRRHIKYDAKGKECGLRDPEGFHRLIKDFYIRYERKDVLPELPLVFRKAQIVPMDENFIKVYVDTVKEFQAFMDIQVKMPDARSLLGWFSRMRNITSIAKVKGAVEWIEEFMLSCDRKLTIFVHHKEAAKALMEMLEQLCKDGGYELPLELNSEMSLAERHETVQLFEKDGYRLCVASTQAAGVGLNLQFCSDLLMFERQWTSTDEEQAEDRFPRPGTKASRVDATYLLANGTMDEFLTMINEKKRSMTREAHTGEAQNDWQGDSMWSELANMINERGLARFQGW